MTPSAAQQCRLALWLQAARSKAADAQADLQNLQSSGPHVAAAGASAVLRSEAAVAKCQQKLDALQGRINDIEDRVFAELSAKVGHASCAAHLMHDAGSISCPTLRKEECKPIT